MSTVQKEKEQKMKHNKRPRCIDADKQHITYLAYMTNHKETHYWFITVEIERQKEHVHILCPLFKCTYAIVNENKV